MAIDEASIGRRVRRVEDELLITGRGSYASDPSPDRLAHLTVYRSPFGRTRIDRLDLEAARALPTPCRDRPSWLSRRSCARS